VLYIVLDDVATGDGPYGGLIETPNIDRIAERGLTYTSFHTTALCSPTRSCLMTGRNHTTNGMATITERRGVPQLERAHTVRVRHHRGGTGRARLEHLHDRQVAPDRRGRDEHGLAEGAMADRARIRAVLRLPGAEDQPWYPDLVYDNIRSSSRGRRRRGYHLTEDLTDKALEFIRDAKAVAPDKRSSSTTARARATLPHQVPKEWIDKYRGKFGMGYEAYREQVFERQKRMGVITDKAELSPINPYADPPARTERAGPVGRVRPWTP